MTTFVDGQTVIEAAWLNSVDALLTPGGVSASDVSTTAISTITATDVQGVLAEIVAEKQPLDNELTALATSTAAANKIPYYTGATTAGTLDWNSATALAASTTTVPSQTVVKTAVDELIANCTTATPSLSADYFVFEDATDNTQKKALLSSLGGITLATAQATTSGTTKDFTIPSGVKRITVMFNRVGTNGTSALLVQIGSSSTPVVTGYIGHANYTTATVVMDTGFMVQANMIAANTNSGIINIMSIDTNIWVESGALAQSSTQYGTTSAGAITLAGTLDIVRITTVSGDTFDAGSVNIAYE